MERISRGYGYKNNGLIVGYAVMLSHRFKNNKRFRFSYSGYIKDYVPAESYRLYGITGAKMRVINAKFINEVSLILRTAHNNGVTLSSPWFAAFLNFFSDLSPADIRLFGRCTVDQQNYNIV